MHVVILEQTHREYHFAPLGRPTFTHGGWTLHSCAEPAPSMGMTWMRGSDVFKDDTPIPMSILEYSKFKAAVLAYNKLEA